jgi:hypothetical protein
MAKRFQRKKEDFICENCGNMVIGNGYTNHCPICLYSKHVDINPGDRLATCKGLMEPVGFETKGSEYVVIQRCKKCGFERKNKLSDGDNFDVLLNLSKNLLK